MSSLPDDVLLRVLELGTETRRLDHRDLCNLAMVNSQFNEFSNDSSLWATLLSHDFPSSHYPSSQLPSKSLYRKKFEEEKMAAPEARRSRWWSSNYRTEGNGICRIPRLPLPARFHHPGLSRVKYTIKMKPPHDCITDQRTLQLEHEFKRSCNIGPKPKAIPNSRYYVPLNKPRRQAMPRKI